MAATVKIDFAIGGSDLGAKMTRTIVQATQQATRAQLQIGQRAAAEEVRARANAERDKLRAATQTAQQMAKIQAQAARDAARAEVQAKQEAARQTNRIALESIRQENRARSVAAKEAAAMDREAYRVNEREDARRRRAGEREARAREKSINGYIGAAGRGAMAGVGAVVSGASRLAGAGVGLAQNLMGGMGIEASVGSTMKKRTERETLATDIANSGMDSGSTAAQRKAKAGELQKLAADVGYATAMDPTKALEGVQKFVSKTGDLKTAQGVLKDLAVLSRATGTSLDDMADAAGDVSANLPETADKAEKVTAVMRAMAGQGKLGAVEVRDLAKQMAGLAAQTSQFGGDEVKTMATLGAMAQETRQKGGAKSASQSVNAVTSFVNTFSKGARVKEFKAAGVDYQKNGQLLDPEEIIVNALHKTKGDSVKMGKLFMDANARRATKGFESIYQNAGGGEAGEKAVRAEFKKLREASMGKGETQESFDASMDTAAAKAERFQQKLDQVVGDMADKLIPAMLKFTPVAEKGADVLGKFVDSVAPNADKIAANLLSLAPAVEKASGALASVAKFGSEYPKLLAGGIIAGYIAKEMAAHAVSQMNIAAAVVNLTGKGVPPGGGGSGSGGGGSTPVSKATGLQKAEAIGAGLTIGVGLGTATADAIDTDLGKRERMAGNATNLAAKIRNGSATAAEREQAKKLLAEGNEKQTQGAFGRFISNATAGYRGLANGDISAGNLASAIPGVAVARGLVGGALEGQAQDVDKNLPAALKELQAALDKPTKLDPGTTLNVVVTNAAEIAAGAGNRDKRSAPIAGQ